jgi:hypothetical protein
MRREGVEVSAQGEGERHKIKKIQLKIKLGDLTRVGGSLGERVLHPPQFRAGGVRTPPAAGCGERRSPAPASTLTPRLRKRRFRESVRVVGGTVRQEFSFAGP